MSLPNNQATRLGGALLTGGSGISVPFANLPSEIITRTMFDTQYIDWSTGGKSGAATVPLGTLTSASSTTTFTSPWISYSQGSPTFNAQSGGVIAVHDWGHVLNMSPGSAANTGWAASYCGAAAAGGTGTVGGVLLGIRSYPRRIAVGGSAILNYTAGTTHRARAYFGLSVPATSTESTIDGTNGMFDATCALVLQIEPNGEVWLNCSRAQVSTLRVDGMSVVLPTASTQFTKLDWLVVGEYTNPSVNSTWGVTVYLRSYISTTTTSSRRPSEVFQKFNVVGNDTDGFLSLPAGTGVMYPFLGTVNNDIAAGTSDYWSARSLWYAHERS